MRKVLLMTGVLLALFAASAMAQVSLNWNTCFENGAATNKVFACNTNGSGNNMVAAWYPPASATQVTAIEMYLNYQVDAATLPCWWTFDASGRATGASVSTTDINDLFLCGGGLGNYFRDNNGPAAGVWAQTAPNRGAWIYSQAAAAPGDPDDIEQFGMQVRIVNTGTVGPGCPGCSTPVCFVLSRVVVNQAGAPNIELTAPAGQQHVTWNGGGTVPCPAATPTKKATWGSIKALYR